MFKIMDVTKGVNIMPWLVEADWGGDLSQAARKLAFKIAYTKKDTAFQNCKIEVGDRIELSYTPDTAAAVAAKSTTADKGDGSYKLFNGIIFLQNRASASYTMEFTAYDNIVYLAKSKLTIKFTDALIKDAITQVCSALGVTPGTFHEDCGKYKVNLVEDGKSGSEIIKDCLDQATAWTGHTYHIVMDAKNKMNVVRCDNTVESYKISDTTNLIDAQHSASIEDMVNQVAVLDKDGNVTGYVKNEQDIKKYGLLQGEYKMTDGQNTQQGAKAMLKKIAENSSFSGTGNIQCIAGYAVEVTEEQINGKFLIASDSHKLSGNKHTMDIQLRYIVPASDSSGSTTEGSVPDTVYQAPKGKGAKLSVGSGSLAVGTGLQAGANALMGTTMDNGTEGCAEAAGKIGSYYSPFLCQECQNGVVSVPQMVSDAGSNCIPFDSSQVEKGDVIVYGDNDHVVIAAGPSGDYVGNSSSENCVVHGDDFYSMGGLYPTKIIKSSHC